MPRLILLGVVVFSGCVSSRHLEITVHDDGEGNGAVLRLIAATARVTHQQHLAVDMYGMVNTPLADEGPAAIDVYGSPARRYRQIHVLPKTMPRPTRYLVDVDVRRCSEAGARIWRQLTDGEVPREQHDDAKAALRNGCVEETPSDEDVKAFTDFEAQLQQAIAAIPISSLKPELVLGLTTRPPQPADAGTSRP